MKVEGGLSKSIIAYYRVSERSYQNWGKDLDRPEIYALHCGFHPDGKTIDQHESVKLMSRKIIGLADIKPMEKVLDAGCGSGSLLFEAAEQYSMTQFFGINISPNQLEIAQRYIQNKCISNAKVSFQNYLKTAFPNNIFDKIIYSESATHSPDNRALLAEAKRLLIPGGGIIISDAFLTQNFKEGSKEKELIDMAEEGWLLPNIPTISELSQNLEGVGFYDIEIEDITVNTLPSTYIMAVNAAKRLEQQGNSGDQLSKSRLACVAADQLMRIGIFGYYWISAKAK